MVCQDIYISLNTYSNHSNLENIDTIVHRNIKKQKTNYYKQKYASLLPNHAAKHKPVA